MELGKTFDLIFGDWVPGVLHTKEYDQFFNKILEHLKSDGLFIGRECLRKDRTDVDLEKAIDTHYKKYSDKYSFYESSMQYVYGYRPDPATSMWNIEKSKKALEDAYNKGLFKKESDYKEMRDALAVEQEGSMSIMVKQDFEEEVKKYFTIIEEHHVKEPSSDWYPIYVMKKK